MSNGKLGRSARIPCVDAPIRRALASTRAGVAAVALICVGLSMPATAKVCQYNANATGISPPSDVREDALESNDVIHVFPEKSGFFLGSAGVRVNANTSGTHNKNSLPTPFTVGVGVEVDSDYIHFDPNSISKRLGGSVTFCRPILGVIALKNELRASHGTLGGAATYPAEQDHEGIEGPKVDVFTISGPDKRNLSFSFKASADMDTLRVITEAAPPTPGH